MAIDIPSAGRAVLLFPLVFSVEQQTTVRLSKSNVKEKPFAIKYSGPQKSGMKSRITQVEPRWQTFRPYETTPN